MAEKTTRSDDGSLGADGECTGASVADAYPEGAVERLMDFLYPDGAAAEAEAAREEMTQDGVDPRAFSDRLKQTVLDAYTRAQAEAQEEEAWRPGRIDAAHDEGWPAEREQFPAPTADAHDVHSLFGESDFADSREGEAGEDAPAVWPSLIGTGDTLAHVGELPNGWRAEARPVLSVPALGLPEAPWIELRPLLKTDRLGLAGMLINMVGAHERLVVRPFVTISDEASLSLPPREIGRREAADCVLEWGGGTVGGRLVVAARLVSALSGEPLGEKRFYDESLRNLHGLSGRISQQIARDLGLHAPGEVPERRRNRYTKDPDAARWYNSGRFHWSRLTESDFVTAIRLFEHCISRDPGFAEAYAGLADCYTWMGILNMRSPQETFGLARERASQALARDDGIAEAHTSLAFTKMYFDWDWEGAEKGFRHAISLNPSYEMAYQGLAQLMTALLRFDEALAAIDQALLIHPRSFIINVAKGIILYEAGRFDECIEQFQKTVQLNQRLDAPYYGLALALEQKGLLKQAAKESRRAIVRSKRNPIKLTALAHIHALLEQTGQARKVLNELNSLRRTHQYVSPFHMALIYAGLGKADQAFDFLEEAYRDKDQWLTLLRSEPRLKELRGDPRFRSLAERLNWPAA